MKGTDSTSSLDFDQRLRRSKGRASRDCMANARVTEDEQKELAAVAKSEGKALSEWAREVLLREARSSRTDALFTEVIATRMLLNLVLKSIACGEVMTAEVFSSVLANVRTTKHQAATDVMEQYAASGLKEHS
jgi:hypothetical protein